MSTAAAPKFVLSASSLVRRLISLKTTFPRLTLYTVLNLVS